MIHSYSLYTSQIDEPELAVAEIQAQYEKLTLHEHTVALVVCHYDYVEDGTMAALSELLPFPVIGYTTFNQSGPEVSGLFDMNITLLTSDDVRFATAKGDAAQAEGNLEAFVSKVYQDAYALYSSPVSLMFSYIATALPFNGEEYVHGVDAASGNVPHFGAIAIGENNAGGDTCVFVGGEVIHDGIIMLLFVGDVDAKFYYGNCVREKLFDRSATVTSSDGVRVKTLNGEPATEFLIKNGFDLSEESRSGVMIVPFVYHYPGHEALIARTLADYTEDGSLLFFGEVPEGVILRTGVATTADILSITRDATERAVAENGADATLFMFSCIGRYMALGMEVSSEIDCMREVVLPGTTYQMCYAGGEICPVPAEGQESNQFHNSSFVVCALR